MNAKELKSVLTKIEKAKEKIATERDKLRELYDEFEALNSLIEIARVNPAIMQIAGDLIVKNMDWDGSEEIAERLKKMLPPNLQDQENSDIPPEVQGIIEQGKQQIEQLQKQFRI